MVEQISIYIMPTLSLNGIEPKKTMAAAARAESEENYEWFIEIVAFSAKKRNCQLSKLMNERKQE